MSLLPRTVDELSSADYWERFFRKRGDKAFEWYGDYHSLCGVLHKYIKPRDQVRSLDIVGEAIRMIILLNYYFILGMHFCLILCCSITGTGGGLW